MWPRLWKRQPRKKVWLAHVRSEQCSRFHRLESVIAMKESPVLKSDTGTYLLAMGCSDESVVEVGAQGRIALHTGVYLYAGSAFGPGGIATRVHRHARTDHPQHWHIDYIRPHCTLQGAWVSYADTKLECPWARALLDADSTCVPKKGLGSSDCGCPAHFMRWEAEGDDHRAVRQQIEAVLQAVQSDATPKWVEADRTI